MNQKAKVKALQDELENPMNVHRWRKLEATDQENYERILKIYSKKHSGILQLLKRGGMSLVIILKKIYKLNFRCKNSTF